MLPLALLVVALLAASTACGGDSGSEEPEAVVRAFTEAVNENDNERAAELLADGAVVYGEAVPAGGGENIVAGLSCTVEIESTERSGDVVTTDLRFTGHRKGASGGCAEVGNDPIPTQWTVRDGKITEISE